MKSLSEIYNESGYQCSICLESYDVKKQAKKPVQLSCSKHNICFECYLRSKASLSRCPECRALLIFSAKPLVSSQVITAMEAIAKVREECLAHVVAANAGVPIDVDDSIDAKGCKGADPACFSLSGSCIIL